ncbi:MAG: sugar ABC transporter substrate-binding protein [Anaerolineales bacterium]
MPLVELVVWADELRAPIFTAQAAAAEELGIQLTVQQMGFGDIRDQLAIAGPAGEGPDIIIGAHDWLGQLVVNGLLSPIDLGSLGTEFLPAALDAFTYEGQLYGVPYATENVAFFCNPDVVETAPATWDDVTALAEELETESGGAVTAWTIQTSDPYHYFPVMSSFGGYVFGVTDEGYDPSDVGLDGPGSQEAAAWLQAMAEAGHLKPDVDYDVMHAQFEGGQVACIGTGPWALNRIRESGVAYTINPYPAGSTGSGKPFLGVQGLMISAFSENQLLAQTFLTEIVATEEFMQAMYDADPRPSALLAVREATVDADLAAFAAAGEEGQPMPAIPEMSSVWEAWANAISLTITQQSTGAEAFTNAAEQIRTAIAQ